MSTPAYHSGSLTFTAAFQDPAFELSRDSHQLQRAIFHALREYEMSWPNFQENGALAGPGKWSLSAAFLFFRASLEIRVEQLEVKFLNTMAADANLIREILRSIEGALLDSLPQVAIAKRELAYQGHFRLPADEQRARLQRFWGKTPDGLGEQSGQGVAFYFRSPLFSSESNIVLDKSMAVDGGLFIQVHCQFDADAFDLATSTNNFWTYLASIDRVFDMNGNVGEAP